MLLCSLEFLTLKLWAKLNKSQGQVEKSLECTVGLNFGSCWLPPWARRNRKFLLKPLSGCLLFCDAARMERAFVWASRAVG